MTPAYELKLTNPRLIFWYGLEKGVAVYALSKGRTLLEEYVSNSHVRWYYPDWTEEQRRIAKNLTSSPDEHGTWTGYWEGTAHDLNAVVTL